MGIHDRFAIRWKVGCLHAFCGRASTGLIAALLMALSAGFGQAGVVGAAALFLVPTTTLAQSGEPPCDPADIGASDGDGDETCSASSSGKRLGNPKGGCDCTQPQGYSGDPIDNSTGNIYLGENDFQGGGAWPLQLTRSYNSFTSVMVYMSPATSGLVGYIYPFGTGWTFTYGARLLLNNESPLTSLEALRSDGQVLTFTLSHNTWSPDVDVNDQLTEQTDSSGKPVGWTLTDADRNVERYDATGHLLSVTNRAGMRETLTYSTSATPTNVAPVPGLLLQVTGADGRILQFTWNAQSRISTMTDPSGQRYIYAYDSNGELISVLYPDQNFRRYNYIASGLGSSELLTGVVDEAGTTYAIYTYDPSYHQGASISLAGGVDSYQLALASSSSSNTAQTTDALGATRNFSMQFLVNDFRNTQVQSPCLACTNPVNTISYTYNANGYVTNETHVLGDGSTPHNRSYTWDTSHNLLLTFVDGAGSPQQRTTNTTWNTALRVPLKRTVQDNSGKTVTQEAWAYNSAGQVTAHCEIDPGSGATSYACGSAARAPAGVRQWRYTYCKTAGSTCPIVGLLLTTTGPRTDVSQTTTNAYYTTASAASCGAAGAACYQPGDLKSVTDALGHVTTFVSYDAAGRVTRTIGPDGVITDLSYTPRGWVRTRKVAGATATLSYTRYGSVASVTDPDGVTTSFSYDAAHRLIRIIDAVGNHIDYTLDAVGHRIAENTYAAGSSTPSRSRSRKYDALGRLVADVDAYGNASTYAYAGNDNRTDASDPLGVRTHQTYDALGRLVQTVRNYLGTDAATGNTTSSFAYDSRDDLIQAIDPNGLSTSYTYNGLNDLVQLLSPDTGTTSYTYDAAGNRITQTDADGVLVTYAYDALDRMTATRYPTTAVNVGFVYDSPASSGSCTNPSYGMGRLTMMSDATGTTTYCYDAHGNVTRKQQNTGGSTYPTQYSWDAADRLMGVIYPDGASVGYTFDADGRVATVSATPVGSINTTLVSSIGYLPFGPATGYGFANGGQVLNKLYDGNYRATDIVGSALNLHFKLDPIGNIVAEGNAAGVPTPNESYFYDPLYRLLQVDGSTGAAWQAYTYNKTGDRLNKVMAGLGTDTYSYTPNTHHLISISGYDTSNRAMDANGNTTAFQASGWTYGLGYNDTNRLTVVQQNGATVATYGVNGLGERTAKTLAGGGTQVYVYDQGGRMLGEYATGQTRDDVWADGTLVAILDNPAQGGGTIDYVFTDGVATPRAVTTQGGTLIWDWPYTENPFGEGPASGNSFTLNLRYPGQYFDQEDGLNYNYSRDYEPGTGRYIQSDPRGLFGNSTSTYGYGNEDPFSNIDPLGLASCDDKPHCEELLRIDTDTCNGISRLRGSAAGAACHASATERYAACLRGRPLSPLNTWNNRNSLNPTDLQYWEDVTGLSGAALAAYLIISEGSRLFPPRNLIPVP